MKKLYTITFALLLSGFTGNLLFGMEQPNESTALPVETVITAYPATNNRLNTIVSYDQNIEFETKYCSKIYISYPKNITTVKEQAYMAQSTIAAIKAYDEKLPQVMNDNANNGFFGGLYIGATLGAAITYALIIMKK